MTINADPQELAKFGELAHRWWDPESDFKPLHQINPLRLAWIEQRCPLAGKRVVDVGCGGGILSDAMARAGAKVLGIDLSTKPLRVAELHALEAGTVGVEYREIAVEQLAEEQPAGFDVVTCMEMIEAASTAHLVHCGSQVRRTVDQRAVQVEQDGAQVPPVRVDVHSARRQATM